MSSFVHLHVHSHYSMLDSTVKVGALIKRTAKLGMNAVAITDHGVLHSCIELQKYTKDSGVRPIFGVELYVQPERAESGRERFYHLVLLAETLDGYRNLVRLVSRASMSANVKRGRPITTYADLEEFHEGLIALSGDMGGEIPQAILRGDTGSATTLSKRLQGLFGEENFFFELQRHEDIPQQQQVCDALVALGERLSIPCVATNNVHYLAPEDVEAHALLMCIGMEKRVDRKVLAGIPLRDLFLKSPDEMEETFSDLPEALANTVRIAERCQVVIPTGGNYLPDYAVLDGGSPPEFLRETAAAGLEKRFDEVALLGWKPDRPAYLARLKLELDVIIKMHYDGYFLVVWDFIDWAKKRGIPVGPGRGSGAGSLVAWSLGITDLDPIQYGLLFERFLNPDRVSMPDFDIDFCQTRRGEVIDYVTKKYGSDQVGQIVTFGQLKAKAVLRDVARVLNIPISDADRIAKLIPNELNIKLADAYEKEPRLREAIAESEVNEYLYKIALALEGNIRNAGIHAAGVVIAGKPLWEYVPVSQDAGGNLITQYAKEEVEQAGLVKFDFLGLKTLTVIDDAMKLVNRGLPRAEQLDFRRIPFTDPKVYDLIKAGDTVGIFQMESDGFRRLMRQLRPDCFEDIVAAVALFRPGPLGTGMVDNFIDCKHGRRAPDYPHPWLEPVLKETYGVMVYQEQVMQVAQVLAGFSLGGADLLRRAMGKKKADEMAQQKAIFVAGATGKGIGEEKSSEVFDTMAHFAGYGFNKSHSAAYAVITFQTGYLKANYPREYYAALMTNDASSTDKVVRYIQDARARGIKVLPPDVNASGDSFSVANGAIRFGLGAIKGVGHGAVEAVMTARLTSPFTSLFDFCARVDLLRCGKRVVQALLRCGAFDSLFPAPPAPKQDPIAYIGVWRARMMAALDSAFAQGQKSQEDAAAGQSSLFSMFGEDLPKELGSVSYPEAPAWDDREVLNGERELTGFFMSGHPLDRYAEVIYQFSDTHTATLDERPDRSEVRIAAVVSECRERPLKTGERMAILQVTDAYGSVEVVVHAKTYKEAQAVIEMGEPVLITGRVRTETEGEEERRTIIAQEVELLSAVRTRKVTAARLELESSEVSPAFIAQLQTLVGQHPGPCSLSVVVKHPIGEAELHLPAATRIASSDALLRDLMRLLGRSAMTFR